MQVHEQTHPHTQQEGRRDPWKLDGVGVMGCVATMTMVCGSELRHVLRHPCHDGEVGAARRLVATMPLDWCLRRCKACNSPMKVTVGVGAASSPMYLGVDCLA
jgi:hypothetical protein